MPEVRGRIGHGRHQRHGINIPGSRLYSTLPSDGPFAPAFGALCVGDVRQFWGYKSPVQPDGGEVLAKRKGGTARGLPLRSGPAQAVATLPALPFGHPPVVRAFLRTARPNSADGRVRIVCKRLSRQRWGPAPQRQGQRFRGHCFVPGSESTAGFPPGRVSRARAPPFRIGLPTEAAQLPPRGTLRLRFDYIYS